MAEQGEPDLLEELVRAVEGDRLFPAGGTVLLACSGGGDSVAMAAMVARLRGRLGVEAVLGHVNHGLRGRSADEDEAFVRDLADSLELDFRRRRADVAEERRLRGGGVMEVARRLRYEALRAMADEVGAEAIATAHTADDRAETLLLNLARGAGPRGLSGPRVRRDDGVVRPMIAMRRGDLRDWLRERGLGWREDRSNEDRRFRRVKVRKELIPWLEANLNPRVVERLAETARLLDGVSSVAEADAAAGLERARVASPAGETWLDRAVLATYHRASRCMIVAAALRELIGEGRPVALARIDAVLERDRDAQLAPGIRLRVLDERIVVSNEQFQQDELAETTLAIGATIEVGGWSFQVERACPDPAIRGRWVAELGEVDPPLTIRSRRAGDRFRPAGGPGERKLSDYMIDRKIPKRSRPGVPVLSDRKGILWIAGHRLDERAIPEKGAREIIRIVAMPPKGDPHEDREDEHKE